MHDGPRIWVIKSVKSFVGHPVFIFFFNFLSVSFLLMHECRQYIFMHYVLLILDPINNLYLFDSGIIWWPLIQFGWQDLKLIYRIHWREKHKKSKINNKIVITFVNIFLIIIMNHSPGIWHISQQSFDSGLVFPKLCRSSG